MKNILKHSCNMLFRLTVGSLAVIVAALLSPATLWAQSMMEYTAQQSAVQATVQKATAQPETVRTPAKRAQQTGANVPKNLKVPNVKPLPAEQSNAYAGQVLESQNTAAGKFLREDLPAALSKVKAFFVDPDGKAKWGRIVAVLALLVVLWKLGRPS